VFFVTELPQKMPSSSSREWFGLEEAEQFYKKLLRVKQWLSVDKKPI
jgi:hypothetical protein